MRNQGYAVEYWYLYGDKKHTEWVYMTPMVCRREPTDSLPALFSKPEPRPKRLQRTLRIHQSITSNSW